MKLIAQTGVILAMVAVCAAGTWLIVGAPERGVVCDPTQLKEGEVCLEQVKSEEGIVWIDARSRAQWRKDGLPGSVLWNLDPAESEQEMEAEVAMKLIDARIVVVYCGDESCGTSRQVADRVRQLGLVPEVKVLRGGWQALAAAGLVRGSNGSI